MSSRAVKDRVAAGRRVCLFLLHYVAGQNAQANFFISQTSNPLNVCGHEWQIMQESLSSNLMFQYLSQICQAKNSA